jgi:DNA helicase-2/ATP-dependent DNA helicase PcrA
MPLKNNILIHSTAGSGKTTCLVKIALNNPNKKILITTYTRNNTQEIKQKFLNMKGIVPKNVEIITWETFLLKNCVRPYQNLMGFEDRIYQVYFTNSDPHLIKKDGKFIYSIKKVDNPQRYYLTSGGRIYSCKISEFAYDCTIVAKGNMISRLENCYDYIFIDEAQDFAGYDFEIMNLISASKHIKTVIVADKRQNTFDTHRSKKNKKYTDNILEWFNKIVEEKKAKLKHLNHTWRCNQMICDFSDALYPDLPKSTSKNNNETGHDGIFYVKKSNLHDYIQQYSPVILVYGKNSKKDLSENIKTMNFGISKGLTFDRVVIIPTKPINTFLRNGTTPTGDGSKEKLYIAITRAKHSVAFLVDDDINIDEHHHKLEIL